MISRTLFKTRNIRSCVCAVHGLQNNLRLQIRRYESTKLPDEPQDSSSADSVPWYLRDDTLSPLIDSAPVQLPELPQGCPSLVKEFVEALATKYGMSDIEVFDMSQRVAETDEEHLADYNIICTGKSEKHVYKAAYELRLLLKSSHAHLPRIEGMVSNAISPVERRRLLKRAGKGPLKADSDFGLKANSWVMCNTHVDNVFIHILTKDRRDQLCLESLWCQESEKDKYLNRGLSFEDSDDIFIGIKRHYHTRRGYSSPTTSLLESLLDKVQALASTGEPIDPFLLEVDGNFDPNNLKHHVTRSQIYSEIHRINPQVILSQKVENAILEKYGNLILALNSGTQLESQRPHDMVLYIEHLLDLRQAQPEPGYDSDELSWKQRIDASFDKLSQFTEKLYMFNNRELDLTGLNKLIPLLWRLTWIGRDSDDSRFVTVTPRMVDEALTDPESSFKVQSSSEPSILLASNRAADILQLIEYTNKRSNKVATRTFNELVMFTYGNASKWDKFWNQWEVHLNLLGTQQGGTIQYPISKWARLITFLALRNDSKAITYFFNTLWDANIVLSLSFMSDFRLVEGQFASVEEKQCVKLALNHMLLVVNEDSNNITNYRAVESLIDSI